MLCHFWIGGIEHGQHASWHPMASARVPAVELIDVVGY